MIQRTLWYQDNESYIRVTQNELLTITNPLVIVGEAGMGKTRLLKWLGSIENYSYHTARQLLNRGNTQNTLGQNIVLVIDALDELSSRNNGDSVDQVLQKLETLGYPRFILACRVADWRSAAGLEAIREQYFKEPLELHLEPFTQNEMIQFLEKNFSQKRTQEIIEHFTTRRLSDLLGNPQTLDLIANVARSGSLPESLTQLFNKAIDLLRVEHSDFKADAQLSSELALDAAGAAFASLILTGNEAITRKAIPNKLDGELPISEIKLLPDAEKIDNILGSRLFRSNGVESFSYLHRRIGEFLGAKWLVKQANTDRKRKRLLALFHSFEFVPANLRGLHAWLASSEYLAPSIIESDPLGFLEYGDSENLTIDQAKVLLNSVSNLADSNPWFYNRNTCQIRTFTSPIILNQIKEILIQYDVPFSFRLFLTDLISENQLPIDFIEILINLVKDSDVEFAIRKSAGKALATQKLTIDWQNIFHYLSKVNDESSIRLVIELFEYTGYNKTDDEIIANFAIDYLKMSDRVIGPLWCLQEHLPKEQIENVLNFFVAHIKILDKNNDVEVKNESKSFAYRLVLRFVENYDISAKKLWDWLKPFNSSFEYQDKNTQKLAAFLRNEHQLRQAIQQRVLLVLESEKDFRQRSMCLHRCSDGLTTSPKDIVALLQSLYMSNLNHDLWKELVLLAYNDGKVSKEVREAALPFINNDPNGKHWLNRLTNKPIADWEIKSFEIKRLEDEKRKTSQENNRLFYLKNINKLRKGEFETIINPAIIYLDLCSDISKEISAHQRIADWIGSDISEACMDGFEANLSKSTPDVSAQDIATILPQGKIYKASYILVVALAERFRKSIDFSDLPDERLTACYLTLLHRRYDEYAGISGLFEYLQQELQNREILIEVIKIFYEPKFQARCSHIPRLSQLMREKDNSQFNAKLAIFWLDKFRDMHIEPETELIDCLVHSGELKALQQLAHTRNTLIDDEKKKNWIVVNFIIDFESTTKKLVSSPIDKSLIWNFRDRIDFHYRENKQQQFLEISQIEWVIKTFRTLWPNIGYPAGGSIGDKNPWDASNFINRLIRQLAKNTSDQACEAIERLKRLVSDSYTDLIKTMQYEQKQIRSESHYIPASVQQIKAITYDDSPQSINDLQTIIIDELKIIQAKIKSDDAESWRGFFDDNGKPFNEERCRDHLLGLIRQGDSGINFEPEVHEAGDREADITCSVGKLRLPIEIKGQWHSALWTGADHQLDKFYAQDWRAESRGIYLVLWFGERTDNKKLKTLGKGKPVPNTPQILQEMLTTNSRSTQDGKIKIIVVDCNSNLSLAKE